MKWSIAELLAAFETFKERSLRHRRFKHHDLLPLIDNIAALGIMKVNEIGKSVEDRPIFRLQYGRGDKIVLLWSQMHGDEPTATMALFDIFNFLSAFEDGYDGLRDELAEELTLYFIPMLNPDGAERYQRRTATEVDMNRDARVRATIEAALLKGQADEVKPQFAFNLHDQNRYYNSPGTANPVAIALLAPAYDLEKSVNTVRGKAMKIIAGIADTLQQVVPGRVTRYDDEHTPREFGDNFQKWGISTILIESGWYERDTEKQIIRKLNFLAILQAFQDIACGGFEARDLLGYQQIPNNDEKLHDLLIRHLEVKMDDKTILLDVAIRQTEITVDADYYIAGNIADLGDLQDFYGYSDLDATGLHFIPARIYPNTFLSLEHLDMRFVKTLLHQGFAAVRVQEVIAGTRHGFPIQVIAGNANDFRLDTQLRLDGRADFFLGKAGQINYAVINGYGIDLEKELPRDMRNIVL